MPISKQKIQNPKLFLFSSALFLFIIFSVWIKGNNSISFSSNLKQQILDKLIRIHPPPMGKKMDAVYVLGGSQKSLNLKYKTTADLFKKGIFNRILILSRPGKTEYSRSLGRNLTNDEWSMLKLKKYGVPAKYVEAIKMKEGFFGTFSEAKGISSLIKERGYKKILLISSPDHTRRAKLSFDNFLKKQTASVYIQASGEKILLRHAIAELIKLKVYQYFLI